MSRPLLIIGNYNYSSWSLRGWLALAMSDVAFDVRRVALDTPEWARERDRLTPAGRVPVLEHDGLRVWDSLAICEYAAETFAGAPGWPAGRAARAWARSVSAEMHAGFAALRAGLPMNCRRHVRGFRPDAAAAADIARVTRIWDECLAASGGPWLFGDFGICDAMYAPVAVLLLGYGVAPAGAPGAYARRVLDLPQMRRWFESARAEPEVIASEEVPE